jgi:hypothetical protein
LTIAIVSRNIADTQVPMAPPVSLNVSKEPWSVVAVTAITRVASTTTFALRHQLADDIVDGRDMVGVDRMPEPENVGEQGRPQQRRLSGELGKGPKPRNEIRRDEQGIGTGQFPGIRMRAVIEQLCHQASRQQSFLADQLGHGLLHPTPAARSAEVSASS